MLKHTKQNLSCGPLEMHWGGKPQNTADVITNVDAVQLKQSISSSHKTQWLV